MFIAPEPQALVFNFRAAVHDDVNAERPRPLGCRIVTNAKLHPNDIRSRRKRERLIDDGPGGCRIAENIHHIDLLWDIRQTFEKDRSVNGFAGKAWIDADHMVALREKKRENTVGWPRYLIRCANHRDGFDPRENVTQKSVAVGFTAHESGSLIMISMSYGRF
jgi:hypothetical protein